MVLIKRKKKLDRYSMEMGKDSCPSYATERVFVGPTAYDIPIDSEGFVPTWALASRFQQLLSVHQREEDLSDSDTYIEELPSRLTPEEVKRWWDNPLSCDIKGLDTSDSDVYDVSFTKNERLRNIHRRIAVITEDKREQARIRREISKAFNEEELEEMTADQSLIIQTIPDGGMAAGIYRRTQWDIPVPIIIYEEGTTPDSIVHEAVHHLRTMNSRKGKGIAQSTFPVTKTGEVDMTAITSMSKEDLDRIQNVEEATTTMEAMLRTKPDRRPSGYLDDVPSSKSPRTLYKEDMERMKGMNYTRVRGKRAVDKVISDFDATNIAEAMIMSRESAKVSAKKLYSAKKKKE